MSSERQAIFRARLVALMEEFGVRLVEDDHYDGAEEYLGSSYTFTGEGIAVPVRELPAVRE